MEKAAPVRSRAGLAAGLALLLGLALAGCGRDRQTAATTVPDGRVDVRSSDWPAFTEVARAAGIDFLQTTGADGRKFFLETTGSGGAWLDYDGDGRLDALLIQPGPLPDVRSQPTRNLALFRNRGSGAFEEVAAAGLGSFEYGQGCAVGDFNNDGHPDVFLANYGPNRLFRNNGDGTFTDVTETAGVAGGDTDWSVSAAFGDFDNDGWADLYVGNYLEWTPATDKPCYNPEGGKSYCMPDAYQAASDRLYRNRRDGSFEDVSERSGIAAHRAKSLGVVWFDHDDDGRQDLYVASDLTANLLFHNRGDSTFEEVGTPLGVAYSDMGTPQSGMGIAVGDYNGDGLEDLFVTNFSGQTNQLYANTPGGQFLDQSWAAGMVRISTHFLAFGTGFLDVDNDGWLDLLVANGHIHDDAEKYEPGVTYEQPRHLYHNQGDGTFEERGEAIPALRVRRVSRGMALGDYDNDGDVDALVVNSLGPAELLRNEVGNEKSWLVLELQGRIMREPLGARVKFRIGERELVRVVRRCYGYASASDPRVQVGLDRAAGVDAVEVRWPDGQVQKTGPLPAGRFYRWEQGADKPVAADRP